MCLQTENAVDDVNAGFLQGLGQLKIRAFIELGRHLDEASNLLAGLGSVDERVQEGGLGTDTVDGHLQSEDLGSSAAWRMKRSTLASKLS